MKRQAFISRIILILGGMSLFGVIVTQMFWVKNAIGLEEKQCDHRVMVALQHISSTITTQIGSSTYLTREFRIDPFDSLDMSGIDPEKLDSLIMDKFCELNIVKQYYYGYFSKFDSAFICGNFEGHESDLLSSGLYKSLGSNQGNSWIELRVFFEENRISLISQLYVWVILSVLFTLVLILSFGSTILALLRQKKLSEIKTDFINNMTHEFKTPISTISVASEMLMKPSMVFSTEKSIKYAGIIYAENKRLENLVERVLQIAVLERGEYKAGSERFDVHEVLRSRGDSISPTVHERGGMIRLDLNAERSIVEADQLHMVNVFSNLLDNAVKYSREAPDIKIETRNVHSGIVILVKDKGIGIPIENQRHVFKQFFRGRAGDIHDSKGFGIGLYYVKTIIEAHGGYVKLRSEPMQGSEFEVYLPYVEPAQH